MPFYQVIVLFVTHPKEVCVHTNQRQSIFPKLKPENPHNTFLNKINVLISLHSNISPFFPSSTPSHKSSHHSSFSFSFEKGKLPFVCQQPPLASEHQIVVGLDTSFPLRLDKAVNLGIWEL